jgi:hypothetical protein
MKRSSALWTVLGLLLVGYSSAQGSQSRQPRVFLQASSHGNVWAAQRDQSMEMAKDFQKNCPEVKVTILQTAADYTVMLNHIEVGAFARDNHFQVANREGDMLSGVREKNGRKSGSIKGGVKAVCNVILSDWQVRQATSADASAPAVVIAPASSLAFPISDPTSVTAVAYQKDDGARVQAAAETTSDATGRLSPGDTARKAKHRKACLELAKDNPSIVCE